MIGEQKLLAGKVADISSLEPLYVKEFYTTMKPSETVGKVNV
jgi:hypothetical protein